MKDQKQVEDINTGPGSLFGIIIIVLIVIVAGVYMFLKYQEDSKTDALMDGSENALVDQSAEANTPEAIEQDLENLNSELDSLDSEITSLESEFDSF